MNGAEVTKLAREKWPELLIVIANDFGAANVRFPPKADIRLSRAATRSRLVRRE
jgi:hypothetical protein